MILADTSIWIDHLRKGDATLARLLDQTRVLSHPLVAGELAMGALKKREVVLDMLRSLPRAVEATHDEVLELVSRESLFGKGLGFIDAHLLAAARLTEEAVLWTRDKRLAASAHALGVGSDIQG